MDARLAPCTVDGLSLGSLEDWAGVREERVRAGALKAVPGGRIRPLSLVLDKQRGLHRRLRKPP